MSDGSQAKKSTRSAGVLLHPTSLPGPYGIGDLGPAARTWVDSLARAQQQWWQILPLGPTGYGDSPYQCFSAFAGNPNLISPQLLVDDGLLESGDVANVHFPAEHVDYGAIIPFKYGILAQAWERFQGGRAAALKEAFDSFKRTNAGWLDDYALFMALKEAHGGKSWHEWPAPLRARESKALAAARKELSQRMARHQFQQFLFFRQWRGLKQFANERGIRIIGDTPIFVSADSADVWANPELFFLDAQRKPTVVAGVPPDYFSATGQLWGNPLYNWEALAKTQYAWWVGRLREMLKQVDLIRMDHFRGFEAYWEVPAGAATAQNGRWVKTPGAALLETLRRELGQVPLIAEDLGIITPEVEALRDAYHLPGMRVLQFAFDGKSENPYLPHNYVANTVVYTGTHDNDTTRGWYQSSPEEIKDRVRRYLGRDARDITWDFIRLAWSSVADYAIVPLQDLLDLGREGRMNTPGRAENNWSWRFTEGAIQPGVLERLTELTHVYGRAPMH